MTPSPNLSTLSNTVFQNKTFHALEIHAISAHLKYLIAVIQLGIFPVPPSTDK